ncbi:type I 3-dehydroquinate dehydratase [Natronomonas sp. EA1]|uniref:type I 3-dehydroquinate dehydratase n=1 Tax=Natronomonas sp. EA1 TaxID=3421655 RepID=UPI003EC0B39E
MEFDDFTLAASTADLGEEPAARAHADCVEFRMDLADDPLDALDAYSGELPILATNRATWEGGEAPEEGRLADLRTAAEHPSVEAIDIELAVVEEPKGRETVAHAHEHDATVVVSVHDFEATPDQEQLERLLARAAGAGDVGKLAVTAHDADDTLALLAATRALTREGARVATMAMGDAGSHTRAVAPVYGSKIGYAPVDPANATAPGQYDLETLRGLVEALR